MLEYIRQHDSPHGVVVAAAEHFGVTRQTIYHQLVAIRQTSGPMAVLDAVDDDQVPYQDIESIPYF